MSNTRKNYLLILLMTLMVAFFAFGCKKEVKVSEVYFNLIEDEQIIMLVGEELNLNSHVEIRPANATNKGFIIESFNSDIASVNNGVLTAKSNGSVQIKVSSLQNPLKQDLMTVVIWESEATLAAPANLRYSKTGQVISFNAVPNAASYSLKINDDVYELGNSTSFKLEPRYFDSLVNVQVRANAPTYTSALKTSEYSNVLKLYQVGEATNLIVGNMALAFNKNSQDSMARIYFNGQLESETNENIKILHDLDVSYAGSKLTIDIEMVLDNDKKQAIYQEFGSDVQIYSSALKRVEVDVVDLPVLKLTSGVLEWQKDDRIQTYEVYLGDEKLGNPLTGNKIDLNTISRLNDSAEHTIKIKPVVKTQTVNIASTGAASEINVRKLTAPVVSLSANGVVWGEIENVSAYAFVLSSMGVDFESSTDKTCLDMANYSAGRYAISVRALASDELYNGVHFISSNETEYSFGKHDTVDGEIANYILNLNNRDDEKVVVVLDKERASAQDISNSVEKLEDNWAVNLKSMDFTAGMHTLTLKKKFDSQNKMLESDETVISFVQLEKVNSFALNGGVATAVVGPINEENGAVVSIVTSGVGLDEDLVVNTNIYTYNTTDPTAAGFLSAGQYESKVFVYGDGSTTFAYRENGEIVPCETASFEVLSVPTLEVLNPAKPELSIGQVDNATYKVYEDGVAKTTQERVFSFELDNGEKIFAVQAVGDGINYLSSKVSDEIVVARLVAPTLEFNRETNVLSYADENDSTIVASRILTKDGEAFDYDFIGALSLAEDTEFTLTVLANVKVGGKYYLNSNTTTLALTKLSPATNAKIENNKLVIETNHNECDLKVKFKFVGGATETLQTGEDNILGNASYALPYTYNDNSYIIDLLDASHNALIDGLLQDFDVDVVLTNSDGMHIDSDMAAFESLNLVKIDAQTTITLSNNAIVLTPENHSVEHGLQVVIGTEEFVSNGQNKLVSTLSELEYTYANGVYNITILNTNYSDLVASLASVSNELQIDIKVKYTHSLYGDDCDLDSDYSASQTLTILKTTNPYRNGQSLKFTNAYPTFVALNYKLLVDENLIIELSEENASLNDGVFTIDIEKVFEYINVTAHTDIHSVQVVTLDDENNLVLANKGQALYFTKNPTVTLSSYKDNNAEDNSTYVEFEKAEQAIIQNRKYVITLKSGEVTKNKEFLDSSSVLGFKLDAAEFNELTGEIEIFAQVLASGQSISADRKFVEIFNSNISEKLNITRISNELEVSVTDSALTWSAQHFALGYEVYKVENSNYIIISKELVKATTFNLEMLGVESEIELAVKAIGENEFTTNSLYSQTVKVNKVSAPSIYVSSGKIVLSVTSKLSEMLEANEIEIAPYVLNEDQEKAVSLDKFKVDYDNNTMTIEAYEILNYFGTSEIVGETCQFGFKVGVNNKDANNTYYLSSALTSVKLYGLFAPTSIRKTTNENNSVEQIMWKSNANNVVNTVAVAEKYLFKFTYTDENDQTKEFYSNDEKLVYKNASGMFESYGTISVSQNGEFVSIIAPYGYDIDGEKEVVFGTGRYSICVQAIPNSTDTGVLLASSQFSTIFEYLIMPEVVLNVEGGVVSWRKQEGATSYTVYVTVNEEIEPRTFTVDNSEEVANIKFDFAVLPNVQGVCKVEVKALSTKDNVLNSAISQPLYIYRLPKAQSVHIDDGNLVFSANKYFTSAVVEFFDVSKGTVTHSEIYVNEDFEDNNIALAVENWKDITAEINAEISGSDNFKLYNVKLSEEGIVLASNKDYKVNVTLFGNTMWEGANNGFINSAKFETISNLTATKLSTSVVGVEKGVVTFAAPENIKNSPKLNYVINKADNGDFWKNNAIIYKVALKYGTENAVFYALDYYAFVQEIAKENCSISYKLLTADYEDLYALVYYTYDGGQLVFDVYYENTINIAQRDHVRYHQMSETNEDGENGLETILNTSEQNNGYNEIDISSHSSFTFAISILGGDSRVDENSADMTNPNTLGCLSAFANNVRTIDRYENNVLSTKDGKIIFNNLTRMQNETPTNIPVYKFVVKPLNSEDNEIFYVYYSSKEEAEQVAVLNGDYDVKFVEIELIEDDNTKHLFDLTQFIAEGAYTVSLQTLAGKANQMDGDYIINAKLPSGGSMNKIVYKLSQTELNAENGVLKFAQSYTINDGVSIYHDCYEITINDGTTDYVFTIDKSSKGVSIDASSRMVTYDLPKQIITEDEQTLDLDENGQYSIKIRAISGNIDGESGTMILNSTYLKSGEEDVTLSIRKTAIAKDVRIENGSLKWVVDDVNNHYRTTIKITYQSNNETYEVYKYSTYINDTYYLDGIYQYHYLTWDDFEDEFELEYREGGYNISLIVSSKAGNLLNSNQTEDINLNVLQTVDESSIKAKNGVLTWESVANATENTQYRVIISGTTNLELTVSETVVDLLNNEQTKNLAAGDYAVQIQALAGEQDTQNISADPSVKVSGFIKLAPVQIGSIVIDNGVFKWGAVEHAEKYKVVFNYRDESTAELEDVSVLDTAEYIPPTGVSGAFSLTIWAIGVDNEKLFNSDSITYVSSTVAPNAVKDFAFDSELKNRFIIEVNDDFTNSDKIVVRYNLAKYIDGGATENLGQQTTEIPYVQGQTKYYLPIAQMGIYTNITAQVYRQSSVPSKTFLIPSDMIDMNLFEQGAGSQDDPYVICTPDHLMNIKYYATAAAHFALGSSINFKDMDVEEIIATNGGFLISESFNGTISGGNDLQKFSIHGFNSDRQADDTMLETIVLTNQHTFALFGSIENATLSHINFGDQNTTLKLINSFALDNLNMISLSWIATNSVNSTINDVDLAYRNVDIEITLNKSQDNTYDVISHSGIKVGAMFATANNTTIKNSSLAVNVVINTNAQHISGSGVYIGGVVANATDCTAESMDVELSLSGSKKLTVHYLGGIYAYFTGSAIKTVSGANVNVQVNNMHVEQFGGIAGHAKKLDITNSSISGEYAQTGVNYNFTIGGIVGEASDVNIANSSSFVEFNISIAATQSKQLIGVIAGNIYRNAIASSIKNCSSHLFGDTPLTQTQITSSGDISLGIYGLGKYVTIEGCTKATKS